MSFRTILVAEDDGVRTITLNRPERRNAMTPEMQEELLVAFEQAAQSPDRVVVLTGAGEAFCAGLDLVHLQAMAEKSPAEHETDAERIARVFRTLYELPKPSIAAVNGAAVAGGTGLAMVCDFTLAVPGAKFGFTEVKIGFVPALVSAFLALQVGEKRVRDLLLTGRLFSAEEAREYGMVNEIVPAQEILGRAMELASVLKQNSPQSMRATKRLIAAQNKDRLDVQITDAMKANAESRSTHDFREGVTAFLEKRRPVWGE